MKIGDRCFVRGYIDEIRKDTVIVRNDGGYFGTILSEVTGALPSAQPEIIRCKDCKYWQDQEEEIVEVSICARPQNKYEKFPLVMLIDGDGFCSYAERRTDD